MHPPEAEYRRRLAEREARLRQATRLASGLGWARLAIVVATLALLLGTAVTAGRWPWQLLAVAAVLFTGVSVPLERAIRDREAACRSVLFYRQGLERIEARPATGAPTGDRFADPAHPYSGDLDLFGEGSLFHHLATCRTRPGEEALALRLARHTTRPATATVLRSWQEAAREMSEKIDLSETLAEAAQASLSPPGEHVALLSWSRESSLFGSRRASLRWGAWLLPAPFLLLALAAIAGWPSWPAGVALLPLLGFWAWTRGVAARVIASVGVPSQALAGYERMAARLEQEPFAAPHLQELSRVLRATGAPASVEIRRLRRIVVWADALRNQIVMAIAPLVLWELHVALALERWRGRCGAALEPWLAALGDAEVAASFGALARERPDHRFPEILADGPPVFAAERLAHPLLDPAASVANDVELGGAGTLLVVSGSNMSGKSTLLRAVGANAVLALSGAPACAGSLRISPLTIATSMRVVDSLQEATSHFLAELKRLKGVTDLADSGVPLLYLLDEVLHGTNSRERLIGVRGVAAHLVDRGAMGLLTTHDLALAALADEHPGRIRNVHFSDRVEGGTMIFDYRMHPGVAATTNAIRLMREVGIPMGTSAAGTTGAAPAGRRGEDDMREEIEAILRAGLRPETIEVLDQTALHAGHDGAKGGGGHLRVRIVAAAFAGKTLMERHRMVYSLLEGKIGTTVHALALETRAPGE